MKLIRLIASPVLMYVLAGLYALILAAATFVENSYGPAVAREHFYYAPCPQMGTAAAKTSG